MLRKPQVAINSVRARQICTKAELDLVLQSTTKHIGNLDAKQLKAAVRRSRSLRDKWRDLVHSQTRDLKATEPQKLEDANARSAEKATLFDETLARFEKRLSKLDGEASKPSPAMKTASNVNHRTDRAAVRESLNATTETLNASTKRATKKAATIKKKSATKTAAVGRNLKAKAKAKATAVARSGAPRIQGHVSSQGRRNQAKRNAR
jgi:hypothetical protein